MNFNIQGTVLIYAKDSFGRIRPITKQNTVLYEARNILADLIGGSGSSHSIDRAILMNRLVEPTDDPRNSGTYDPTIYVDFYTSVPALLRLDVNPQVVGTKNIVNTITVTYSPTTDAPDNTASVEYQSVIPAGTLKVALTPGGDPDPDVDKNYLKSIGMISDTRAFSYAMLTTPILLDPTYTYTIKYTYRIN